MRLIEMAEVTRIIERDESHLTQTQTRSCPQHLPASLDLIMDPRAPLQRNKKAERYIPGLRELWHFTGVSLVRASMGAPATLA